MSADDCGVHNDGENAIVNASRDRLVIDGVYSAGNRCARDVTCTFTIQLGTLPDTSIDVGSWRDFRVQKTITGQHVLPAGKPGAAAKLSFRFRGAVDTVPAGESVDFRVLTSCAG